MERNSPKVYDVMFYETPSGNQPARDVIKELSKGDQKEIGADIRVIQNSFPVGLPLVRKLKPDLWEIRSIIKDGVFRVFFTVFSEKIILLHAIVKKSTKAPPREIEVAVTRLKEFKRMQKEGC